MGPLTPISICWGYGTWAPFRAMSLHFLCLTPHISSPCCFIIVISIFNILYSIFKIQNWAQKSESAHLLYSWYIPYIFLSTSQGLYGGAPLLAYDVQPPGTAGLQLSHWDLLISHWDFAEITGDWEITRISREITGRGRGGGGREYNIIWIFRFLRPFSIF